MTSTASPPSKAQLWVGRALSAVAGLGLIASAGMKLSHNPEFLTQWSAMGFPESAATPIGVEELVSALLYLIPQTAVLGVVLITGHLGGAIVTHIRLGESFAAPVIVALLAWGGLYLREERLRALLPFRRG